MLIILEYNLSTYIVKKNLNLQNYFKKKNSTVFYKGKEENSLQNRNKAISLLTSNLDEITLKTISICFWGYLNQGNHICCIRVSYKPES